MHIILVIFGACALIGLLQLVGGEEGIFVGAFRIVFGLGLLFFVFIAYERENERKASVEAHRAAITTNR